MQHAVEHHHRWRCGRAHCHRDIYLTRKIPFLCCLDLIDKFQYVNRKSLHQKPTAHISYHEGLRLIRSFLDYASHHTVEEIQAFTSQWVPNPGWVKVDQVTIPPDVIIKAADTLVSQLGARCVEKVGGSKWWQWRRKDSELRAEWIEMRGDYTERMRTVGKGRRVMLYVHGGAYFFGSVDEHRYQMQRHARKLRARVFAPRYRLAPQFPFPCGLHDCLAAYLHLLTVQEPGEIILAGDSAGGGMVVSLLVILRDQGLPMPAGAVLISPWVDLTHSFPSVAGSSDLDYIPAHGFMQKPSPSWPPPNDDEMAQIAQGHLAREGSSRIAKQKGQRNTEAEAMQGYAVQNLTDEDAKAPKDSTKESDSKIPLGNIVPGAGSNLSIEIDGKLIILTDQIQLYATNHLISHPLVSPILQPSLGGLPPLLILTGGGEVLRDEQIYLAHKAANPGKYPLDGIYQAEYDPSNEILNKYKPTDVQLQVWDDLCHVAPTLSFTRPAKFMYRSIAQFGAWALARAQRRSIEITDDDDVSIISSGSDTDSSSSTNVEKPHLQNAEATARVGKAGDPLPAFKNHMICQRVNRHGVIYPMAPESEIPALQMPASAVGVVKPGPVRKWLAAKKEWDTKYASERRKVQKRRIKEMMEGGHEPFGEGERPPPGALAGRRRKGDEDEKGEERKKQKKSWGMSLWSLWGSRHDESTIRREEEMVDEEEREEQTMDSAATNGELGANDDIKTERPRATSTGSRPRTRRKSRSKSFTGGSGGGGTEADLSRSRSRTRTTTVSDEGQTGAYLEDLRREYTQLQQDNTSDQAKAVLTPSSSDVPFLSPAYIHKHLKASLDPLSRIRDTDPDTASISTTGAATLDNESLRNASTIAVFSAPGVIRAGRDGELTHDPAGEGPIGSGLHTTTAANAIPTTTTTTTPLSHPTTPLSTTSKERLWGHNDHHQQDEDDSTRLEADDGEQQQQQRKLQSPSMVAVVGAEGVVGVVDRE
jgi:acetyl esterase/lipase